MTSIKENPGAGDAGAQRGMPDCGSGLPQVNSQSNSAQGFFEAAQYSADHLLEVFIARAEARAVLTISCDMTLQQAVDGLWDAAIRYLLVDRLGVDGVQEILSRAFERVPR